MPNAEDLDASKYLTWHADLPIGKIIEPSASLVEQSKTKLQSLLKSVNPTAQADLVWFLKKFILIDFAMKYNVKRVLLATSGHGISSKLLSSLSKGRGANIANEVSYCEESYYG